MLAPASEALSNPCLPAAWREAYGPWAFLFATAAMMGMHLVDYLVKVGGRISHKDKSLGVEAWAPPSMCPCRPASLGLPQVAGCCRKPGLLQSLAICSAMADHAAPPQGHYQRIASQQQQQQLAQAQAAPAMPHVHVHARGGCHEHTSAIVQALAEKDRRAAAAQRHAAEAAEHAALLSAEDGAAADGTFAAAASSSRSPRGGCRGGSCKGANGLCSGICSMEGEELCVPLLVKERREQSLAAACVSVAEDASHVSCAAAAVCAAPALCFPTADMCWLCCRKALLNKLARRPCMPMGSSFVDGSMPAHPHPTSGWLSPSCQLLPRSLAFAPPTASPTHSGLALHLPFPPLQVIGLYMTEAGIIFHSLMIGVTLGVTGGAAFATLLIALALHQVGGRACNESGWQGA